MTAVWRRGGGAARGAGVDGAGAGAAVAGAAAGPARIKSAGNRLTLFTVVAAGPTGGATELPTVILSASGFPVFKTGAVAVCGTA
jgi:hypothetical protein